MTDIGIDPQGAHAATRGLPLLSTRFKHPPGRLLGHSFCHRPAQHGQPQLPR